MSTDTARIIHDEEIEIPTLSKTARDLFAQEGTTEAVRLKLVNIIAKNHSLREEAIDKATRALLHDAIYNARIAARSVPNEDNDPSVIPEEVHRRLSRVHAKVESLLDWPLMDGTPLSEATKEKCLEDAARFRANAKGNIRNAVFLEEVANKLRPRQKVRNVLTHKKLMELMNMAEEASK